MFAHYYLKTAVLFSFILGSSVALSQIPPYRPPASGTSGGNSATSPAAAKPDGSFPKISPVGPKKYAANEVLYTDNQFCDGGKTLPDSRYVIDLQKETVLDKKTNLMWKRCPEGVAGEYCELFAPHNPLEHYEKESDRKWGKSRAASMKFYELNGAVQRNLNFAGYTGWRVATIDDFLTIRDNNCKLPAMNSKAFPAGSWGRNGLPTVFWTSSVESSPSGFQITYIVVMTEGSKFNLEATPERRASHSSNAGVRLVRNN